MRKIKVLIVDDSSVARALLRNLLESDKQIEIVGEAADGLEAIRLVRVLKPHLVTMDLNMPVMSGMDSIVEIMATQPVPILVVSDVADAQNSCNAIARGALDVFGKSQLGNAEGKELVAKVKLLADVHVIPHLRTRLSSRTNVPPYGTDAKAGPTTVLPSQRRVFAIASSTGGPQALGQILGQLPKTFPCSIFIAQHIAYGFAAGMVKWLSGICRMPIKLVEAEEDVQPATIYFAPSEHNLAVSPVRRTRLSPASPEEIYHPNCDRLLGSIADVYGRHSVGVILTGMGKDGASGMEQIHKAGGVTLAQDETSSVVFGMNKVAIDRGVVQTVLPVGLIAREMCRLAGVAGD